MKLCLLPFVALIPLTIACTTSTDDSDDGGRGGDSTGTGATANGTGGDAAGTGGASSSTGGSASGTGGTGLPTSGITTEALETVDAKYWPANTACADAATFVSGPMDDGTGNIVMHLKADGHAGTCDGGSPSVSLSISQASLTDDIARSKGVKFHIRSAAATSIRFLAQSAEVVPLDQGGACPTDEFCWNAHEKTLALTDQWQEVTVLWDDLTQTWGIEDGDKKANVVVLYPSDIQLLSWALDGTTGGEIWIDGIELIANDGTGVQSGIANVISKAEFNAIVGSSASYTYEGFVAAAAAFPAFAGAADPAEAKREVAAFLANAKWETGSFQFTDEQNPQSTYCDASKPYGCPGGDYHGRGALQLSWNYNYKDAGDYMGIDLLNNPGQVSSNPALLWETAIWFWMRPGVGQTPHAVFKSGFGQTIQIINGDQECGGKRPDAVNGRLSNYNSALSVLATDAAGTATGC